MQSEIGNKQTLILALVKTFIHQISVIYLGLIAIILAIRQSLCLSFSILWSPLVYRRHAKFNANDIKMGRNKDIPVATKRG